MNFKNYYNLYAEEMLMDNYINEIERKNVRKNLKILSVFFNFVGSLNLFVRIVPNCIFFVILFDDF